jgi:hypothetical protein
MVTKLTNLISKEGYYVKSVVEHQPYRDDGRANVINHVWDIAGRWYEGVFPIDFDVNLRGEDLGDAGSGPLIGRTIAQVTVKGTYVNEAGLAQRKKIDERWDKLHGHVVDLLSTLALTTEGAHAITAGSGSRWNEDFVAGAGTEYNYDLRDAAFVQETEIVDAEIVDAPQARERQFSPNGTDAATELRRQQRSLVDALIAERISEETYREITARIDAELRKLGEYS